MRRTLVLLLLLASAGLAGARSAPAAAAPAAAPATPKAMPTAPATTPDTPDARLVRMLRTDVVSIPAEPGRRPLRFGLATLMRELHITGLSMAVVDRFRIAWTGTYGVTAPGSSDPVTPTTLFQAASISKVVTAMAALRLVEQGRLSLDEDVNMRLVTWKVPENRFTRNEKVTLRRIMSHTAGTTVHGFPGYTPGAPLPTLKQILDGRQPANSGAVVVDTIPGTRYAYSGGGVAVEQQLLIDVTREPFPKFMRETVLDRVGMTNSTFEQPLPQALAARAATGTEANGAAVPGRWHIYPEMAAAGLWTTPTDLATLGIEVALSRQGRSNHVLSEKMTHEMLTPVREHVGLGFFLDEKNPDQFGHTGGNEGFQSILLMLADSGQGVAIMSNSSRLYLIEDYLVDCVARAYGWRYVPPKHSASLALTLAANARGVRTALGEYSDLRKRSPEEYSFDEGDLNQFGYELLGSNRVEEALEAFRLNVSMYPKSWNVYDSLGEALMKAGQTAPAIRNYEKSLELNPGNENGRQMLAKLRRTK